MDWILSRPSGAKAYVGRFPGDKGSSLFSVEWGMKMTAQLSALPIPRGLNHSA